MALRSQAVKTAPTDELTDDHRALDLDATRAVSIDGATLIECDAYTRTDDGAALRFDGSEPLFVVGLCSERKARDALADAGYRSESVDRAFELGEWMEETRPERATAAIRTAERDEARAMADGGQPDEDDEHGTTDVHGCATCSGYAYGDDDQCPECQRRDVSPVGEEPL